MISSLLKKVWRRPHVPRGDCIHELLVAYDPMIASLRSLCSQSRSSGSFPESIYGYFLNILEVDKLRPLANPNPFASVKDIQ